MNNYDEEESLDDIFGTLYPGHSFLDNGNDSPFADNLQVPLHDDLPLENSELDSFPFSYNETSLSVPVREYPPEAPSLSPMPSYQSYEMPQESQLTAQGYNSFEQPVGVINGEYTHPIDEPPLQHVEPQQHYIYTDEVATTSGHQAQPSTSNRHHTTPPPPRNQPPLRNAPPTHSRQRPIQPKTSSNSSNRRRPGQNDHQTPAQGQQVMELRVDDSTNAKIAQIMGELSTLKEQQKQGICNNTMEIEHLEAELLQLFGLPQGIQAAPVLPAAPPPAPRPSRPSRSSASRRQYETPDSPPYQPQILMAPSTSQATVYSDYAQPQQVIVQHAPVQQAPHSQGQIIRVQQTVSQQHVQVSAAHGGQQLVYVQQTSNGQFIQQPPPRGQRTYVAQPQPIQPKPPIRNAPPMAKVILKPPPHIAPPMAAQIISRQQPPHHQQLQQPPPVLQRMQAPVITQPMVAYQPVRQPAAQIAQLAADRKYSRRQRVLDCLSALQYNVDHPETERPFRDLGDVLKRLIAYHSFNEPEMKEDEVESIDANLLRTSINQDIRVKELKSRLLDALYKEPQIVDPPEEQNLLLWLDTEYERRKLEEERELSNHISKEDFVQKSSLIPSLRGVELKRPTPLNNPPRVQNQWEYNPFAEAPQMMSPVRSPYLLSPSSSNRSESPMKTPSMSFLSPRLRTRSVTNYNEDIEYPMETAPPPPARTADKKTAAERRIAEKKEKEAKEAARKQEVKIHVKSEPLETYQKVQKPTAPTKPAPSKPVRTTIKLKQEEPEPSTSSSFTSELRNLPSKKMFLNRARQEVPLALRSPPAQMMRPLGGRTSISASNGMDSDGSVSPELGDFGDIGPPPRAPITPVAAVNDIKSSPLKKLAPLPAPQPKKPEPATSKAEEKPRIIFKPIEPKKEDIKNNIHLKEKQAQVVPASHQNGTRPIKLKFKIGGDVITVSGGVDEDEKQKRKEEKRKRKEAKRRKRDEHERNREERNLKREMSEAGPSWGTPEPAAAPREINGEYTVERTEGLKFKFKLSSSSRTATPAVPHETPTTSRVNGYILPPSISAANDTPPPPKIPKLKIRLGPERFVVEPAAPVSRPMPPLPVANGPSAIFKPLKPEEQGDLPAVTFSDQSDGDDDLMRATDETMRSWGMSFQAPPTIPAYPSRP